MFLGANDGFPMGNARCCGEAWVTEYARRARGMMHAYARGGRARVLWLLLPAPRDGLFRKSFPAVEPRTAEGGRAAAARRGHRRPGEALHAGRAVPHMDPGQGGGGGGAPVRRHAPLDHGAAIAASIVVRTLRRERIIR